jgi:hypothetical protein
MERVTPRTLKHTIRHCNAVWQELHGECDYVELLLLTILKYAANEFFGFIQNNIVELRRASENPKPNVNRNQELITKINGLLSNPKNLLSEDATIYWLNFLFPGISDLLNPNKSQANRKEHARRIANSTTVNYFNRILNEVRPPQKISDQRILHAIQNWNNNENTQELVDLLSECQHPEDNYYEHWLHALQDNSRILNLTQEVLLKKNKLNLEFDEGCRILMRGWYPMRTKDFENLIEWFKNIFNEVFPRNIRFVADIYWHFACTHYSGNSKFCGLPPNRVQEEIDGINQQFIDIANQTFVTPEDIVHKCFQNKYMSNNLLDYLLRQYCKEFKGDRLNDAYHKASDWHWLALILIRGLQSQDDDTKNKIYLLTIMHLIGEFRTEPDNNQRHYFFSEDQLLNLMFGDEVKQLMELLSNFDFSSGIVGLNHEDYILVQNEAREWLQTNQNPS